MTEQTSSSGAFKTVLISAVVIIAVVIAVVQFWPESQQKRESAAVDVCKDAVDKGASRNNLYNGLLCG